MKGYDWLSRRFKYAVDNSVVPAYMNHSISDEKSAFALECCRLVFEKDVARLSQEVQDNPNFSQSTKSLLRKYSEKGLSLDWKDKSVVKRFYEQTIAAKRILGGMAKRESSYSAA